MSVQQELQKETASWTLASDEKLLEHLKAFSNSVVNRTKQCAEQVDTLAFDVAESEVSLRNAFNDFLMLGNTQFIENVSPQFTVQK